VNAASGTHTFSSAIETVMSKLEVIIEIGDKLSTVRMIASISSFQLTWLPRSIPMPRPHGKF
jgi:hypothetical protein